MSRFVHCSSVHAFDLERCGPEVSESSPRTTNEHAPAYDRSSKGENEIRAAIGRASMPVSSGVWDPTTTAPRGWGAAPRASRPIPVNVGGGFDFVDVRISLTGCSPPRSWAAPAELGHLSMPLSLIRGLAPLVLRLTPSDKIPLFTPESLHALQYAPSVCHYKASKELGYLVRPITETIRDTYAWFDNSRQRTATLSAAR